MSLLWLPAATRDSHGGQINAWSDTTDPKGVLHTTESSSWPSYAGWTIEPHATVLPHAGQGVEVRQHIPFSSGSFALKNLSGGVQTNKDFAFQFELVGTCDSKGPGYHWPSADDAVLKDLWLKVVKPLSVAYKIPVRGPVFKAYPGSYGTSNGVRFSGPGWDGFTGWCGHQHVPENDHGDPGDFPFARLAAIAAADLKGKTTSTTPAVPATPVPHVTAFVYAEGDDKLFFPAALRGTRAALVTDRALAAQLIKQGATVVVVGGPAVAALGLKWATAGATTKSGKVTAVNGATFEQTGTLALQAL